VFSHELRNSLRAIRGATHILRMETSAGPAAAKARAMIERQVGQMSRLVEDILDVSRMRSGHLRLQCERIDLCAVAAHAAQPPARKRVHGSPADACGVVVPAPTMKFPSADQHERDAIPG